MLKTIHVFLVGSILCHFSYASAENAVVTGNANMATSIQKKDQHFSENSEFSTGHYFLRGDTSITRMSDRIEGTSGGETVAIFGKRVGSFNHGVKANMRRLSNFKIDQAPGRSYRLETESAGFIEKIHIDNFTMAAGIEAGRLSLNYFDEKERFSFAGASTELGFLLFNSRDISIGLKIGAYILKGGKKWQDYVGNRPIQGLIAGMSFSLYDASLNSRREIFESGSGSE